MITDIHAHIIPSVDDGAIDFSMSLEMIQMAYEQGIRDIYCTSHNPYDKRGSDKYQGQFIMLEMMARSRYPDFKLHKGCELLCAGEYIDDILYGLEIGVFAPLGNSNCVLTELYSDVTPSEATVIVKSLISAGWKPIIAHAERYPDLFDGQAIENLIDLGAMIQVNLYSLVEEKNEDPKQRARWLVDNKLVHFIGSDAHRTDHRPPKYDSGIQYLKEVCDKEYFEDLCYKNAVKHIMA